MAPDKRVARRKAAPAKTRPSPAKSPAKSATSVTSLMSTWETKYPAAYAQAKKILVPGSQFHVDFAVVLAPCIVRGPTTMADVARLLWEGDEDAMPSAALAEAVDEMAGAGRIELKEGFASKPTWALPSTPVVPGTQPAPSPSVVATTAAGKRSAPSRAASGGEGGGEGTPSPKRAKPSSVPPLASGTPASTAAAAAAEMIREMEGQWDDMDPANYLRLQMEMIDDLAEEIIAAIDEEQDGHTERIQATEEEVAALREGQEATEEEVAALREGQEATEEEVAALREGQEATEEEVAALREGQEAREDEVATLREGQEELDRKVALLEQQHSEQLKALTDTKKEVVSKVTALFSQLAESRGGEDAGTVGRVEHLERSVEAIRQEMAAGRHQVAGLQMASESQQLALLRHALALPHPSAATMTAPPAPVASAEPPAPLGWVHSLVRTAAVIAVPAWVGYAVRSGAGID